MTQFDISKLGTPLGPPTNKRVVDISADDFDYPAGFICQVGAAGDLTYMALNGSVEQTDTLAIGAFPSSCGIPVLLREVSASAAIGSIVIGTWNDSP